jgi:electron transport complex protein RnfC
MSLLGFRGSGSFRHGVHPPEAKDATAHLAIRQFPFAPLLVVPLSQHAGKPAVPIVREGQQVERGQTLARPDGFVSVAMHAPASGIVRKIALAPSITGRMTPAVYLEPWPGSSQEVMDGTPCPADRATPAEIVRAIQEAGVVGLGGAAFPTHVKLQVPEGKRVETLILNGAECEPFLTTDHRVMLEQRDDLFLGLRYLARATGAGRLVVGIERNKADAAAHLRAGVPADLPVEIRLLRVKYPQGAEKMLVQAITGRQVPSGKLPIEAGALVVNVATAAEIGRLLPRGRGIQERVVTVTGPAVRKKGNYRIPIGTPIRFVLETVGVDASRLSRVFLGGPMMGQAVSSLDIPLTKGVSGVVAFDEELAGRTRRGVLPCIRCGYCLAACPMFLNPSELGLLARNGEFERMAEERHLFDCFECGSCSFVCPSHLPLVQEFRVAKAALRKQQAKAAAG